MLSKDTKIKAGTTPNLSDDSVRINAGSFVIDNAWVDFSGTIFKVTDYITSVVIGNRTRFFKDRNYAVFLLVGLDPDQGIQVLEGTHVPFTTLQVVPAPTQYNFLPLVGVILRQDGTADLNFGYLPLKNENIVSFSGYGNILDKDLKGITGSDSTVLGDTGLPGCTGPLGPTGIPGAVGSTGMPGPTPPPPQGYTGLEGMTGVQWNINIPFVEFF
jgi:hypothetical protein